MSDLIESFFISDTLNEDKNIISDQRGKLFFNRNRIVEYTRYGSINKILLGEITKWVEGVLSSLINLQFNKKVTKKK